MRASDGSTESFVDVSDFARENHVVGTACLKRVDTRSGNCDVVKRNETFGSQMQSAACVVHSARVRRTERNLSGITTGCKAAAVVLRRQRVVEQPTDSAATGSLGAHEMRHRMNDERGRLGHAARGLGLTA